MNRETLIPSNKQSQLIVGIASSFLLLLLVVGLAVVGLTDKWAEPSLSFEYRSSIPETQIAVYYDVGEGLNSSHSYTKIVQSSGDWKEIRLVLPDNVIHGLRLDPAIVPGTIGIRNLRVVDGTGAVRLQIPPSAIRSGDQILSRIENNGELEIQTTPNAYDPNLPIPLKKQIDLRLSRDQATSVKAKRILSRVISVWWVIVLAGLFIFDMHYRPLFQRSTSLLYQITRRDPTQKPKTMPIKKRPMDYLAGTVILLFLIYAAVFNPSAREPHIRSDGNAFHIWTHAIKSGDYSFCRYQSLLNPHDQISGSRTIPYATGTGELKIKCHLIKPPGVALLRLPLMIWFVDPDNQSGFSKAEHQISQLSAIIALMLIIIVVTKILRHHHIGSENIQLAILSVVFGAGLYSYASLDNSMGQIYGALGTTLFSLATFVNHGKHDSRRFLALVSILSLMFLLVRMTNVFIIMFFWAFWVYQKGMKNNIPRLLSSGLGILGAIGVQVAYNYYVTSQLTFSSYGNFGFIWDRPMFWSVLFSYQNSLVFYFPIFAVILFAGSICKKTRTLSFYFLGLVLFYALLSGFWYKWHMGPGFGNRLFVDLAPMLIIILAMACKELPFRARTIIQIFCVLSALLSVQFMWGFWQRTLPEYRTGQIYWSHLLGQEQTPIYWHGILLLVCGVIFYRIVSLEKRNRRDKQKKARALGTKI